MSEFEALILTRKGKDLMAKAQIGATIEFSKVVLGDGSLVQGQTVEAMEAVLNSKMDVAIHSLDVPGDGSSEVRIIFNNTDLEAGFFIREIGLMAIDPDVGEILYSYSNAGQDCDFLIAGGGARVAEIDMGLITVVGNAAEVTARINSNLLALLEDVTNHDIDPDAHAGRLSAIEDSIRFTPLYTPHKIQMELFSPGYTIFDSTTWTVDQAKGQALAVDGGTCEFHGLQVYDLNQNKAAVVRRSDNDAVLNAFYRDADHTDWTPAEWEWERNVENGMIDVEYQVPARGLFAMRFESAAGASAVDPVIDHIIFVECEPGKGGMHRPPATPTIVFPANGAAGITEQPSLTTGAFSSPVGEAAQGVRFQVASTADFTDIVVDSGVIPGVSWSPDKGVLTINTPYHARALHVDVAGGTSAWSPSISFTTAATFIAVDKPTCITPAAGVELGAPDGLTLVSSAFASTGGADTHKSSQWQVANDSAFSDIIHDSGPDATNLTSYNVPDSTVARGDSYYWRVRHEGTTGGWSDWSLSTMFSVSVMPPVEDVFSTMLYSGTGAEQSIDNGLDLASVGGLVWLKSRQDIDSHFLFDTARDAGTYSASKWLNTNNIDAEAEQSTYGLNQFLVNGFKVFGSANQLNASGHNYASWSFLKAVNFFDIVTWVGDGQNGRQIPHTLGIKPGMIAVKAIEVQTDWPMWHRRDGVSINDTGYLNRTDALFNGTTGGYLRNSTAAAIEVGGSDLNAVGRKFIAYLFAHDPSESGLIQCGSLSHTYGSNTSVELGWQPQHLLIKASSNSGYWFLVDTLRAIGDGNDPYLHADSDDPEITTANIANLISSGFALSAERNSGGYIYMAIRKPAA